jgi:hypothetical protein
MPPGAPPPGPMAPMAPPPKKMTSGLIIALIGGLLMLIGTFLPWATVKGTNILGTTEEISVIGAASGIGGILVLVMGILVIIMAAIKKPILAMVFGIIGLAFSGLAFIGISALDTLLTGSDISVEIGIGIFISLIGCVLALVGGIVGKVQQ